jgi:hypothetical protein
VKRATPNVTTSGMRALAGPAGACVSVAEALTGLCARITLVCLLSLGLLELELIVGGAVSSRGGLP